MAMNDKVAILSGRYELTHPGHIKTIRREARRFARLYVYIVDNPEGLIPSVWEKEMIDFCTIDMPTVITILDPCHFGFATQDDIDRLPAHDVFLSANPDVSERLRGLGESVEDISLTPGYSSTDLKEKLLQQAVKAWRRDTGK